ncbi:MAG: Holliday junction branch migration DNA helicase RuvB, partial [Eubacteriaceae bacterium]|nr:Holliday junction branch migration DNA helicase RuvB [Eubacteriaceae bacterium]
GTPRIANRFLKRVRDYAQVMGNSSISKLTVSEALKLMEVDEQGLDKTDIMLLDTIINKFSGGPVGLDTLSAVIGEERETIEDVYEPYLMQIGFLNRTPRGRVATQRAFEHLGKEFTAKGYKSDSSQKTLFDMGTDKE